MLPVGVVCAAIGLALAPGSASAKTSKAKRYEFHYCWDAECHAFPVEVFARPHIWRVQGEEATAAYETYKVGSMTYTAFIIVRAPAIGLRGELVGVKNMKGYSSQAHPGTYFFEEGFDTDNGTFWATKLK
jgi:hypothetical protein